MNIPLNYGLNYIPNIFQCIYLPRFTYDYAECAVHGCEDFNIDWLKEAGYTGTGKPQLGFVGNKGEQVAF